MQMKFIENLARETKGKLSKNGRVTLGLAYDGVGLNPEEDIRIIKLVRELGISPITLHYVGYPHGRLFNH